MDANSAGFPVFLAFLQFAFFAFLVATSAANPKLFGLRKFSTRQYILILTPLVLLNVGLFYALLDTRAVAASPVRMPRMLVPPPAAIADPPLPLPRSPAPRA